MNTGIERVCDYCFKVISIASPFIWFNNKGYHEECYVRVFGIKRLISPDPILTHSVSFSGWGENSSGEDLLKVLDVKPKEEKKPNRKSWHNHFAELALKQSEMATCSRLKVGCVIVRDEKYPIGFGINGSVCGDVHCIDEGCLVENNHCVRCVHSECNSLLTCAKYGISVKDCSIYITHFPCFSCTKMIINSGIKTIYYINDYKNDSKVYDLCEKLKIKLEKVDF